MQAHTSREKMGCRKLTLYFLWLTIIRGVASQDFAEKHSVPFYIFRHMLYTVSFHCALAMSEID